MPARSTARSSARPFARSSARRCAAIAALIGGAGLTSCAPGVGTTPTTLAGQLSTRSVTISVTGAGAPYSATAATGITDGAPDGFTLDYNSSSAVISVRGTLAYDRGAGAGPALTLSLDAGALGMTGSATVVDPLAGVAVSASGVASSFSADDHGNVSGSISEGAVTISFATASAAASGSDAALESLLAAEADYCADAQQRLAGLDDAEVPLGSITNTRETPRSAFAASKAVVSPLTVRTWTDTVDVRSSSGALVTISKHISCKTRAADHVATTGVGTAATDAACSVLNQRSIDLALAQMTPAQQSAVTLPTLGGDVVRQTGVEWTTPLPAAAEFDGSTLRAHALLVRWNDPDFAIFPDTIRGVHYCTVWSPAYAYSHLLDTLP